MPSPGVPIGQLTKDELLVRYECVLKACWWRDQTLLIPSDIRHTMDECRSEIDRRGLEAEIIFPAILRSDDPDPISYEVSIIRYFKKPGHLEDFLNGIVSFAPAAHYRDQPDAPRHDDEHVRPYATANQVVTIAGVSYPTEEIRMRRHIQRENGSPFPYHILSFSDEQSTKLRRDFESCGEVLVRDIQLFFDLLCEQLRITQPQATLQLYNVDYYDPFAVDPSSGGTMDILWRKPIQFLYQREVRLVIVNGQPECERISLHIKASDGLFELIN